MDYVTVAELAELFKITERSVQRRILNGDYESISEINGRGRKKYKIAVESLPDDIKRKYYSKKNEPLICEALKSKEDLNRPFESFNETERGEILFWQGVIKDWERFRSDKMSKAQADAMFLELIKKEYPERGISKATLYRKRKAVISGDLGALCERRGGKNKGESKIRKKVWDYFVYVYLDQRRLSVAQCYELTKAWAAEFDKEALEDFPSAVTFARRIKRELFDATVIYGREGDKALNDKASPYILRRYEDLEPNDYWIADNHTLDVITENENGGLHRLHLTAFIDARSQVMVGWNLTDNPSSASTVLALRNAIKRFGIPKNVYMDNGSEFLTYDIAGRGHRTRKSSEGKKIPPHIFERLGINMVNALVRNARAKPIERAFLTFKGSISRMFETFCGGNVLERPENLKIKLKDGNVLCDGDIAPMIAEMIDGVYNVGQYGGYVKKDRGKRRIDVWNENIKEIRKPLSDEDLNLMLMRSTRPIKVSRAGIVLNISGVKLHYCNEEIWKYLNKKVYVRYDPDCLNEVRIYNAEDDRFIMTVPMSEETMLPFNASGDKVKIAQKRIREIRKAVKDDYNEKITSLAPEERISIVDMQIRRANAGKGQFEIKPQNAKILKKASGEVLPIEEKAGGKVITIFDINRKL